MWNAPDLDANNRIYQGTSAPTVDMGVYEHGSYLFRIARLLKQLGLMVKLTWNNAPGDTHIVWSPTNLVQPARVWTRRQEATIQSQGEATSWIDPHTSPALKFYRVGIE